MRSVEDIIERAKLLSSKDRRRVLNALKRRAKRANASVPRRSRASAGLYGPLLTLAGTAHVDATDIASDKYRYFAAAYSDIRDK